MKKKILTTVIVLALVAVMMVGCKGAEGIEGLRGPAGPQGAAGIQGDVGPQGEAGLTGASGASGSQGEQGIQGEIGPAGAEGPAGARGPGGSGSKGAKGDPGAPGSDGIDGDDGDKGDPGPAFPNLGILLYVEDGTQEIAHVTYDLDEPIALEDLVELTFFQELIHGEGSYGANVILGIDVDGDGYEANDLAWHIGETTQHNPAVLGDDTFIAMDGAHPDAIKVDALTNPRWWTTNTAGDGFGALYTTYPNLIDPENMEGTRLTTDSQVCLIRLVVGGSGSWIDMAIRVTSKMIPTKVGVYSD